MPNKSGMLSDCRVSGPVGGCSPAGLKVNDSLWIEPHTLAQRSAATTPTPDYAEVTQARSVASFRGEQGASAYATTTLVPPGPHTPNDRGYCLESSREPLYSPPSYHSRMYSDTASLFRGKGKSGGEVGSGGSLASATLRRPSYHSPLLRRPQVSLSGSVEDADLSSPAPLTHQPLQWRIQTPLPHHSPLRHHSPIPHHSPLPHHYVYHRGHQAARL